MDMFNKYKSLLGYQNGENQIDTYGVNHSNFSVRDELAYQMLRQQKEGQMINNYNQQGITKDYPQYSTNFWGSSPDNNFGFGNSHISPNIENMQNTLTANIQNQTYNNSPAPSSNSSFSNSINPYARIKQLLEQNQEVNNTSQLAQNSLPNSGSDVNNMSKGNFSPEALKERMLPVIRNMEKPLDYIYIDTTWNKTTGAGANVDDWDTFNQINWEINGRPATEAEKQAVFNIFQNEINQGRQNKDSEGNIIKNNKKASSYIDYSQFRLAKGEVDRLLRNHITEDIKYLQKEFPDFAYYPPELQNVLLDIKFNTGNVSQENWPKLRKAIAEKNLFGDEGIIYNVHRKDVGEDRNYWTEQQIRNIKSW